LSSFLGKFSFIEKPKTPKARRARHRQHDLPSHPRRIVSHLLHTEANIDIGDEEASRADLQLAALLQAIHTSEDDVAGAQIARRLLPAGRVSGNNRVVTKSLNHPSRYRRLVPTKVRVRLCGSDKSIQIRLLNEVGVVKNELPKSDMRKELDDVGTPASQANNAYGHSRDDLRRLAAEERLAAVPVVAH
jgi:hypothetical protein